MALDTLATRFDNSDGDFEYDGNDAIKLLKRFRKPDVEERIKKLLIQGWGMFPLPGTPPPWPPLPSRTTATASQVLLHWTIN